MMAATAARQISFEGIRPAEGFLHRNAVALVTVGAYAAVYAASLTFGYVEGDDAASIAYHAMGRNPAVQMPYSAYHGMMDRWLALLPANEAVLRTAAIAVTAVAACAALMLMLRLAYELIGARPGVAEGIATAFAVLLAIPELFYLGLVYEPSMVALSLVLGSHLLARRSSSVRGAPKLAAYLGSAVLFGVGTACRWDIGIYGLVIVADRALGGGQEISTDRARLRQAMGLSAAMLLATVAAIWFSGYGWAELIATYRLARHEIAADRATSVHLLETFGAQQALFTPWLIIAMMAGAAVAWRQCRRLLLLALIAVVPLLPYLYSREPKMLLPALPSAIVLAVLGIRHLWWQANIRWKVALLVIAIAPWAVGAQVIDSGTSYGPGFERTTNYQRSGEPKLRLAIAGGFAVPTPEGPRPLGGHAAVLLGGGWRQFVLEVAEEQQALLRRASQTDSVVVQLDRDALLLPELAAAGYSTPHSEQRLLSEGMVVRDFTQGGRTITMIVVRPSSRFLQAPTLSQIARLAAGRPVFLYFGNYANVLRRTLGVAPRASARLGAFSASTNVAALQQAIHPASLQGGL